MEEDLLECNKCHEWKEESKFSKSQKRLACKECLNKECREYKRRNKAKISAYNKKYKAKHREEIKEYNRQYSLDNRKTIQKCHTMYLRNRRKTNPEYKMSCVLRNRIKAFLFGENRKKTRMLLGCEYDFIRDWLESQFTEDMTFENHGSLWHIDHVIPCSKFTITDEDDQFKCFNWTNLQPMVGTDNMSKGDTLTKKEYNKHLKKVNKYLEDYDIEKSDYMFGSYSAKQYIDK